MKYVYVHGFGSKADPKNVKVEALGAIPLEYDSYASADEIEAVLSVELEKLYVEDDDIVVVGTSLGGYWAARMADRFGLPFVAINPSIEPNIGLRKYDGVSDEVIDSYDMVFGDSNRSHGLVLLDLGDEVIPARESKEMLEGRFDVVAFDGGNHRFAHIEEALPIIEAFAVNAIYRAA